VLANIQVISSVFCPDMTYRARSKNVLVFTAAWNVFEMKGIVSGRWGGAAELRSKMRGNRKYRRATQPMPMPAIASFRCPTSSCIHDRILDDMTEGNAKRQAVLEVIATIYNRWAAPGVKSICPPPLYRRASGNVLRITDVCIALVTLHQYV